MKSKARGTKNVPVCKFKAANLSHNGSETTKHYDYWSKNNANSKLYDGLAKWRNESSTVNTKTTLTTQDSYSYTSEIKKSKTDELMALVGLGNLKKTSKNAFKNANNIKPIAANNSKIVKGDSKHKRISSEISNISQFENVDEDSMQNEANKGKYWKFVDNGKDKSIFWFSDKFALPKSPKFLKLKNDNKDKFDYEKTYLATEHMDGYIDNKIHPHWLTGAKGFETSFLGQGFDLWEDEELSDLIITENCKESDNILRESDHLVELDELSDDSQEVHKLALDTEEDDMLNPGELRICPTNSKDIDTVNVRVSDLNMILNSPEPEIHSGYRSNIFKQKINYTEKSELDLILEQDNIEDDNDQDDISPVDDTNFNDVDSELLITGESNEYEIEEYQIFDQGIDERKIFKWLLHNGNLVKKSLAPSSKTRPWSRTSIKNSVKSLSTKNSSLYASKSLIKSTQRSSYLLKMKVKEITNKLSGKKTHTRNKSRNYEKSEWTKHNTARKGQLESISEFSYMD